MFKLAPVKGNNLGDLRGLIEYRQILTVSDFLFQYSTFQRYVCAMLFAIAKQG